MTLAKKPHQNSKGQATIFVAMMMVVFLSFFSFVVNTGLLVNAKINLQNAADLAAYAGAAVQARQLNQASYLNYEMRRAYKKFLFRYYVMGNMAQRTHPNTSTGDGLRLWSPDGSVNFGIPAVCMIFNETNNFCFLQGLPPIPQVNSNPLDGISEALKAQLEQLERIRKQNCVAIGNTNKRVLLYWLYNTDPNLEVIESELTAAAQSAPSPENDNAVKTLQTIRGLASGLGLFPKEVLLLQRLKTLEFYLNSPSQENFDLAQANDLMSGAADVARYERPIQAFFSAFNTLGQYSFLDQSIRLTELLPSGTDGSNLAQFTPIRTNFESYFIDYPNVDPNTTSSQDCRPQPTAMPVRNLPIGVKKDLSVLTYYAIRLEAKTRLPFSPFGEITLQAYSAAQPFGSRMGPQIEITDDSPPFVNTSAGPQGLGNFGIPNLPVTSTDNLARGWNQTSVISGMFDLFRDAGGQVNRVIGPEQMEEVYHSAAAPNPSERAKYNIINDLESTPPDSGSELTGDPFVKNFGEKETHVFWAPLGSSEQFTEDPNQEVIEAIQTNFQGGSPQELAALSTGMQSYLGRLRNCQGNTEDGECFQVAVLRNPFKTKGTSAPSRPIQLPSEIYMSSPNDIKTSWNDLTSEEYKGRGRTGYSVKFVSFDTLLSPGQGGVYTNGPTIGNPTAWTNLPRVDAQGEADLEFLKH